MQLTFKWFVALGIAALLGTSARFAAVWLRGSALQFRLSKHYIDLGVIPKDQDTLATVIITNDGGGPLKIIDVHGSCVCVHGSIDTSVVPPKGEGEALDRGQLGLRRRCGASHHHPLERPARPEQRVTIHYSVGASHIEFEPAFVDFGRVMRSELPADRSAAVRLPLQADASPLAKRQISIGALD